jgi:hypothetical protein
MKVFPFALIAVYVPTERKSLTTNENDKAMGFLQ